MLNKESHALKKHVGWWWWQASLFLPLLLFFLFCFAFSFEGLSIKQSERERVLSLFYVESVLLYTLLFVIQAVFLYVYFFLARIQSSARFPPEWVTGHPSPWRQSVSS